MSEPNLTERGQDLADAALLIDSVLDQGLAIDSLSISDGVYRCVLCAVSSVAARKHLHPGIEGRGPSISASIAAALLHWHRLTQSC